MPLSRVAWTVNTSSIATFSNNTDSSVDAENDRVKATLITTNGSNVTEGYSVQEDVDQSSVRMS